MIPALMALAEVALAALFGVALARLFRRARSPATRRLGAVAAPTIALAAPLTALSVSPVSPMDLLFIGVVAALSCGLALSRPRRRRWAGLIAVTLVTIALTETLVRFTLPEPQAFPETPRLFTDGAGVTTATCAALAHPEDLDPLGLPSDSEPAAVTVGHLGDSMVFGLVDPDSQGPRSFVEALDVSTGETVRHRNLGVRGAGLSFYPRLLSRVFAERAPTALVQYYFSNDIADTLIPEPCCAGTPFAFPSPTRTVVASACDRGAQSPLGRLQGSPAPYPLRVASA
jgi:hypothetical protein